MWIFGLVGSAVGIGVFLEVPPPYYSLFLFLFSLLFIETKLTLVIDYFSQGGPSPLAHVFSQVCCARRQWVVYRFVIMSQKKCQKDISCATGF